MLTALKRSLAVLLLLHMPLGYAALAQVNAASLTGLITDTTGAVVPGATITAINTATNVEQTTKSDSSGYFTFPSLPIGVYQLTVETQGFKKSIRNGVALQVGQKARIDFVLEIGQVSESVSVTSSAPLLTTQDAITGTNFENRIVRDLPLSIRNWDDLLSLVAGVQNDRYTEEGGGTAAGRTGGANVHGVRSLQNNFVLDGVDNNSISTNVQELTTQVARPSVDSINEFKVSTNPYNAENGRSPGALVSVTTKSGTNSFHGTVYEFHRNRIFDANSFFLNRAGRPRGQNIQNQFGGNLGGPIMKNKAFFFFNYEGTRIRKGATRIGNVPLANELIGDFSAEAAARNQTVYGPIIDRVGDCVGKNQPFPNNQIPARCIDPVAAKILSLLPPSNITPDSGPLNINNFVRQPNIIDDTDSYTTRGDWQADDNNSVFIRYTYSDRFRFVPGTFGGIVDGTSTSAFGRLSMKAHSAAIAWNHIFSPRLVNEFRLGWGRNISRGVQDPFGQNTLAEFGIKGVPDSPIFSGGLPGIVVQARGGTLQIGGGSGVDRIGSPDFLPKFQITNQFQWFDAISLTFGAHQMKFGVDLRAPMRNIFLDVPGLRGSLTFDGQRTGNGLADFLLGYPSGAQLSNLAVVDQRLWMYSNFFQDDWKITPRLTVNIGLRYDFATWPYEGADRITNFDPKTGQTFTPENSPYGKSLIQSDKNNFAPRLGIAFQLDSKTVLRTGYGRFYMLFERAGSEDQLGLNLPWLVNNVVSATSTATTVNDMRLRTGFNLSLNPSAVNPATVRIRAVNPEAKAPSVDQWNLGIQRLLPGDMVVTFDYVGTKGTHLSVLRNLNQQFFNADGTGTGIIPYPQFGPIEFRDNGGNSIYHGGEATLEKRFSHGLSFHAAYTYSKSIDEAMEHLFSGGSNSFMQDSRDRRQQRGRSDFDYRHRFAAGYAYDLPFGKGREFFTEGPLAHALGDWRFSGLVNTHSGRPFTVFAGTNNGLVGNRGGLANAVADCLSDGTLHGDVRTIDIWFNPNSYAVPTPARLGTCGRNTLDGPGYSNVDFALARSFKYFGENRSLEFRWEVFNAFNHAQFGLPERNRASTAVGRISTLAGDPRVMQFAMKFYF
ncbi:MAG TPA: TonB-dependent receptor [Blastocatellia bacterium]|nr:TonB-dependent receptor [Blastocatellia bacterium]